MTKTCGEMYAVWNKDDQEYHARDCHRPARFRVDVGLPKPVYRCGIHVRWYRRNVPTALIVSVR